MSGITTDNSRDGSGYCCPKLAPRERLLWVTSSRSLLYHLGGGFRPEADARGSLGEPVYD